jgi:putative PIN family toxin of toxin-antitoxin system
MKVTVDTNILISATGWNGNERELIRRAVNDEITIIISDEILNEYLEVIQRTRFSFLSKRKIKRFVLLLIEFCEIVHAVEKINVIKDDPSDNMILACAKSGKADIIVSGDSHLLGLKTWSGIEIVSSRELLKRLQ